MKAAMLTVLFLFVGTVSCFAQQTVTVERVTLPAEVRQEINVPSTDPDIKDLQWNRWTSDSFVVCSINDKQAQYLVANLENIKNWVYQRWGFGNLDFVTECRLICVDDPKLYKKFFDLEESRAEIRYDKDTNKPNLIVIFYLLDQPPSATVPGPLTEVCLFNLDEKFDIKSPTWAVRGMRGLNGTLPSIKTKFTELDLRIQQNQALYFSRGIFEMTPDQYKALDESQRKLYNNSATAMCLYLRNEYGQDKFHSFYYNIGKGAKPADTLKTVYGYTYQEIDERYKRFLIDVTTGLRDGSVRNSYLQVNKE